MIFRGENMDLKLNEMIKSWTPQWRKANQYVGIVGEWKHKIDGLSMELHVAQIETRCSFFLKENEGILNWKNHERIQTLIVSSNKKQIEAAEAIPIRHYWLYNS